MDENNPPKPEEPTPEPEAVTPESPEVPPAPPEPETPPAPPEAASAAEPVVEEGPMIAGAGDVPYATPTDPTVSQDERMQAMICWIIGTFVSFIGPLVFLLISKDKVFLYHHAAQSLTVQIAMAILYIVGFATICLGIGAILILLAFIGALTFGVLGAVAAYKGQHFYPPVTGNLSKSWFKA